MRKKSRVGEVDGGPVPAGRPHTPPRPLCLPRAPLSINRPEPLVALVSCCADAVAARLCAVLGFPIPSDLVGNVRDHLTRAAEPRGDDLPGDAAQRVALEARTIVHGITGGSSAAAGTSTDAAAPLGVPKGNERAGIFQLPPGGESDDCESFGKNRKGDGVDDARVPRSIGAADDDDNDGDDCDGGGGGGCPAIGRTMGKRQPPRRPDEEDGRPPKLTTCSMRQRRAGPSSLLHRRITADTTVAVPFRRIKVPECAVAVDISNGEPATPVTPREAGPTL